MDGVFSRANAELNDPNSPYYLGRPSSISQIDSYLRGGYRTNYFGPNASRYLSSLDHDAFMLQKSRDRRNNENLLTFLGIGVAAITAWCLRGKIPFIGKFLKKAKA